MRVLMVTPSFYPIQGGIETVIKNLSTRLNQRDIETDVMTFNMDKKWATNPRKEIKKIDGLTVFRIPGFNWFPFRHSDRITLGVNIIPYSFKDHLKEYDIIHFHIGDFSFPVLSKSVKHTKIAHFHCPLDYYKTHVLNRAILRKISDLYIAITMSMCNDLRDLGIAQNKIRCLPNAVDINLFKPIRNKEDNLLLFVGRITRSKGLHVLLKSLSRIRTKTRLVIIGPNDWDTDYFQEIQEQIEIENRKNFHQITYLGAQNQETVAKWCQKASIFVLPSFKEAFSVSILEALACATPVVATDIPGIREAVTSGKNGFLIGMNDEIELASKLQYLLDNKALRTQYGREGREIVFQNFSWDIVTEKLCQIYKEIE
jgi:glycosyltransferase involved in cell wall biosynthesis